MHKPSAEQTGDLRHNFFFDDVDGIKTAFHGADWRHNFFL